MALRDFIHHEYDIISMKVCPEFYFKIGFTKIARAKKSKVAHVTPERILGSVKIISRCLYEGIIILSYLEFLGSSCRPKGALEQKSKVYDLKAKSFRLIIA